MPAVYAYGRYSDELQNRGDYGTLDVQRQHSEAWFKFQQSIGRFDASWSFCWFSDPAVSSTVPFQDRPGGRDIMELAKSGDIIIAYKYDRMYRSTKDFILTTAVLTERDVGVYMLDMPGLDTTTPVGRMAFTMRAAAAQFEREEIARRTSDAAKSRVANGIPIGIVKPWGWTVYRTSVDGRQKSSYVPDKYDREWARIFYHLQEDGWSLQAIENYMIRNDLKRPNGAKWFKNEINTAIHAAILNFPKKVLTTKSRTLNRAIAPVALRGRLKRTPLPHRQYVSVLPQWASDLWSSELRAWRPAAPQCPPPASVPAEEPHAPCA
jgi:DNA invertase Pin-like site-specific DNA recombinase